MSFFKKIPENIWVLLALALGLLFGAFGPSGMANAISDGAKLFIRGLVFIVPAVILFTVSPAISDLIKRGKAGKFAGNVILVYVGTGLIAAFIGTVFAVFYMKLPISTNFMTNPTGLIVNTVTMMKGGLTMPWVIALYFAVIFGIIGGYVRPIHAFFAKGMWVIEKFGKYISIAIAPIIFCFAVTLTLKVGPSMGLYFYGTVIVLTAVLCLSWTVVYFGVMYWLTRISPWRIFKEYWFPTGVWAWSTASSYATLPLNIVKVKEFGVRDEVTDFTIPLGATVNSDGGAMGNLFVVFLAFGFSGITFDAAFPLVLLPVMMVFSIASAGIPSIGPGLFAATAVATMLGVEDPMRATVIATALALVSGIPDSFRTLLNVTDDGFVAIVLDHVYDAYFAKPEERKDSPEQIEKIHKVFELTRKISWIGLAAAVLLVVIGFVTSSAVLALVALYGCGGFLGLVVTFLGFVIPPDLKEARKAAAAA